MTKEELENLKRTVDYSGYWYDVIGEERIVMLEKSIKYIDALEQEKCELLGLIQDKDKAIKDLKEDNKVMSDNYSKMEQKFYDNLTQAKELLARWVSDKPYTVSEQKDLISDTEQFLKGKI